MGRQDFSQIGYGYNEVEAKRNAIEDARDMYGDQEGYSGAMNCATEYTKVKCIEKPKVAKSCAITKNVNKGARKWETVFIVDPLWESFGGENDIIKTTQGDAIKRAKELALKHQIEYKVTIDKRLVGGVIEIARITPKKSQRGRWLFKGMARC
jgi:hypothetical protein